MRTLIADWSVTWEWTDSRAIDEARFNFKNKDHLISHRDRIGVEIYLADELVIEIFSDDTKKSREMTLYKKDVSLRLVEESTTIFKKKSRGSLSTKMLQGEAK